MSKLLASPRAHLGKFGVWLKGQWIGDVPDEIAVCEFDCRKMQCLSHEWENCPKRLAFLAQASNPKEDGHSKPNDGLG